VQNRISRTIEVSQILGFFDPRYSRKGSLKIYGASDNPEFAETCLRPRQTSPLCRMSTGARLVLHAKYNWYQRVGHIPCALRRFAASRHELRIRHELSFLHLIHSAGLNLAMNCRPPIRRQRSMTGCARWVCPRRRRERPGRRLRGVGLQRARIGLREGRPRLCSLSGGVVFLSRLVNLAPACAGV
jgi:hypothetical protein